MTFQGLYTALITPFSNGEVDAKAFQALIDWQINEGVHGIVPCGTTGESPTLTSKEHEKVIELAVEAANGRVPVMAGAGSNSTIEAIEFTKHAKASGADAVLLVAPYYNKPTQAGIIAHYEAIANAVDIPQFIYNIPGRSVIDINDDTLSVLANHPNIVGIKDATGDLARVASLKQRVEDDFIFFSGEDSTAVGFNAMGGTGCISVSGNVAPKACAELQALCLKGDYVAATALADKLEPLHQAMFCETSPIPVKYALSVMGKCRGEIRLPLQEPTPEHQADIHAVLHAQGLLSADAA